MHCCSWTLKIPPATGVTEGILGSVKGLPASPFGAELVAVAFAPGRHSRVVACGPCSVEALLDGQAFDVIGVTGDQGIDAHDRSGSENGSDCDGGEWSPDSVLNRSKHVKHTVVIEH